MISVQCLLIKYNEWGGYFNNLERRWAWKRDEKVSTGTKAPMFY